MRLYWLVPSIIVYILGGAHIHEGIPNLPGNWAPGMPNIMGCPEFYDTGSQANSVRSSEVIFYQFLLLGISLMLSFKQSIWVSAVQGLPGESMAWLLQSVIKHVKM